MEWWERRISKQSLHACSLRTVAHLHIPNGGVDVKVIVVTAAVAPHEVDMWWQHYGWLAHISLTFACPHFCNSCLPISVYSWLPITQKHLLVHICVTFDYNCIPWLFISLQHLIVHIFWNRYKLTFIVAYTYKTIHFLGPQSTSSSFWLIHTTTGLLGGLSILGDFLGFMKLWLLIEPQGRWVRAPHGAARSACQARCESGPTALAPPSHSHQRHLGHHCQHDLDHKSNIIVIINLIIDTIVGHL